MNMDIMVIDDDPINLKVVCKYIKELDLKVHQAKDGVEAWNMMQSLGSDIVMVLTDRMMPNMDGIELTRKIKADPRFKDVPVIMLTAAVEARQVIQGNEAGVYYYITKPFEKEMLLSIVSTVIDEVKETKRLSGDSKPA